MRKHEQPNPVDPENYDDSPYADRIKGTDDYRKNLERQRSDIAPQDAKQGRINKIAREVLKKLNIDPEILKDDLPDKKSKEPPLF